MASQGPLFPGTTATLANAGTSENAEAWINPGNIVSDNGTEAQITAATYDSPDISQILVASNFGFSVSGTVNGITVEIDRRSIIANSGKDFRVQLATGTAFANLVGDNKAVPATIWPTTTAVATYGGAADAWNASLTAAQVNAAGFAVFLSCQANIANADVGVDFIRVTVTYTPPTDTTITPSTAALVTAPFAPTVTATNNQTVTPGVLALATALFAPVVTATAHQTVTPATATLALAAFAPTVSAGVRVTPETTALNLTAFAPVIHQGVTPATAALTASPFAPTVTATNHQQAVPTTATLSLTGFAPSAAATANVTATPSTAALTLTTYAPALGGEITITPGTFALSLSAFAPSVDVAFGDVVVTPDMTSLVLTAYAPTVIVPVVEPVAMARSVYMGRARTTPHNFHSDPRRFRR